MSEHGTRRDSGFSLVELSVAMVVAALVLAAAGTVFSAALRANATTESRLDGINAGRVAMSSLSRTLRTAIQPNQLDDAANVDAAFLQGSPSSVSFYANINNEDNIIGPSRVTYSVTGGRLVQTVQRPLAHAPDDHNYKYCDPAAAGCQRAVRVLAENVITSTPLFSYYAENGQIALASTCGGSPCIAGSRLADVDAVEIVLKIGARAGRTFAPTTYVSRVSMPNRDTIPREDVQP